MVLTALENTYATPPKDITPFQHWFNKHSIRLRKEFLELSPELERQLLNDKFMKWCNEQWKNK